MWVSLKRIGKYNIQYSVRAHAHTCMHTKIDIRSCGSDANMTVVSLNKIGNGAYVIPNYWPFGAKTKFALIPVDHNPSLLSKSSPPPTPPGQNNNVLSFKKLIW